MKLEGHAKNILYATICDLEFDAVIMTPFERMLDELHGRRDWTISAPELVDYFEEIEEGEEPIHIYGCALELYSAFPPWGDKLPLEIDRQHFEETELLITALAKFASEHGCSFEVQLDATYVGTITPNKVGKSISVGLLEEWAKKFEPSA